MRWWTFLLLGVLVSGFSVAEEITESSSPEESSTKESDEENDRTTWRTPITRATIRDAIIDISLNQIGEEEECRVLTPARETFTFSDLADLAVSKLPGVRPYSSSEFVSCRVTIGPMNDELLGEWTLVGSYVQDGLTYERKQLVTLNWHSRQTWSNRVENAVTQVVNFGGTVTPNLNHGSTAQSCHVVTPNDEDLLLLPDSEYPNITRVLVRDWVCTVRFDNIHASTLGDWQIYGIFGSGVPEFLRRPLHFALYDEEDPYKKAYNRTLLELRDNVVNLESTIRVEVAGSGALDSCYITMANGELYKVEQGFDFGGVAWQDTGSAIACRVAIGPIAKEMLGEWTLIAKFSRVDIYTETQHKFRIVQEDPANPLEDDRRAVSNLASRFVDTQIGSTNRFTLDLGSFTTTDSCHLRTPDGLQYTLMEGFHLPGVEVIDEDRVSCGVVIHLANEELIGDWVLIARETVWSSDLVERRLPITLYVEEFVRTSPSEEVIVAEGNEFFIRLEQPTELHSTCNLLAPGGEKAARYEFDPRFVDRCGFIVRPVSPSDSGVWEIAYGPKIVYRAQLRLTVLMLPRPIIRSMNFTRDRPVDVEIGPTNAIFCRVEDPYGVMVFSGFSACRIRLDRVTREHRGWWTLYLALPGHVLATEHRVDIIVLDPEPRPVVTTSVVMQSSPAAVLASCSVSTPYEVNACQFRDPQGNILMASHGLGQDRYTFHGSGVSFHSGMYHVDCGLKINDPMQGDLGLWRCAVDTSHETYFGFLSVLCPWSMQDPVIAANVQSEPVLKYSRDMIVALEGDSVTMMCKTSSSLRYCYYRSPNGTVFNLTPGTSTNNYAYVGEGLGSGECGMVIQNVHARDDGAWACNVGLTNVSAREQRAHITLVIYYRIQHEQYMLADFSMNINAWTSDNAPIEYCRFVRRDGFAFTTDNMPYGYESEVYEHGGHCRMTVNWPTSLDRDRWTIAVKVVGRFEEVTATSSSVNDSNYGYTMYGLVSFYLFMVFLAITVLVGILLCFGSKKRRERVVARASSLGGSIRNSFRKRPLETPNSTLIRDNIPNNTSVNIDNNTPAAAL